jgi:hypothetical protein
MGRINETQQLLSPSLQIELEVVCCNILKAHHCGGRIHKHQGTSAVQM